MSQQDDFETAPCAQTIGGIENDIPLDGDIEDGIIADMDAKLEDECMESIRAV